MQNNKRFKINQSTKVSQRYSSLHLFLKISIAFTTHTPTMRSYSQFLILFYLNKILQNSNIISQIFA